MRTGRVMVASSIAALLLTGLSACGSDDTPAAPASTAGTTGSTESTGEDVSTTPSSGSGITHKVMAIGPFPGASFSFPGIKSGLEAAVQYVNEDGGVGLDHDRLEVVSCNTQGDPNIEAQCVREAVEQKVIAVIGGLTLSPNVATPVLEEAGIPWIAVTASAPDQLGSTIGFPTTVGPALFVGAGAAAVAGGCANPVLMSLAIPAAQAFNPAIEAGVAQEGGSVADSISIPATATDFAPSIAQALDADADCLIANVPPNLAMPFMTAVKGSGEDLPVYGITGGIITPDQAAADPELFATVTAVTMTPPIDDSADVKEFQAAVSDHEPDDYAADALNYLNEWLGVKMLTQATAQLDEISAESVLEGMRTTTFDLGFGYPAFDFSTPLNDTTYRGVYNTDVRVMKFVDGTFRVSGSLDTRDGLLALEP